MRVLHIVSAEGDIVVFLDEEVTDVTFYEYIEVGHLSDEPANNYKQPYYEQEYASSLHGVGVIYIYELINYINEVIIDELNKNANVDYC